MYTGSDERKYLVSQFNEGMKPYSDKRIILYGLGLNTEYIIKNNTKYNIVGLMDAAREGENVFGLPVFSADKIQETADVIVIVARLEIVAIIYDRIKHLEQHGIYIVLTNGKKVSNEPDNIDNPYWESSYKALIEEIDKHDAISFDIFDTLIMRKILKPEDIFEVVEKSGYAKFREIRINAQSIACSRFDNPTYDDIYTVFNEISGYDKKFTEEIKNVEFETELKFIVPRTKIVEALEYSVTCGKIVSLISDMYFTKREIQKILEHCGINLAGGGGVNDIIVSSDVKACKYPDGALFEHYKSGLENGLSLLHIGDNPSSDIECARKCGIDAFYIMNAYEMVVRSSFKTILVHIKSIEDKIIFGMISAELCNDPFALCPNKGKVYFDNAYQISYVTSGPLTTAYLYWLINECEKSTDDCKIFFLARDGYIVNKLYEKIVSVYGLTNAPKGMYVLGSRRGLAVPAIFDENDILFLLNRVEFKGKAGMILYEKFGVTARYDDDLAEKILSDKALSSDELTEYILSYKDEILKNSECERAEYLSYIQSLDLCSKDTIKLFDLQTGATCAYFLDKLLINKVKLLCILFMKAPDYSLCDSLEGSAYLGEDTYYLRTYNFSKAQRWTETMFTSFEGQFIKFENGKPVFAELELVQLYPNNLAQAHSAILRFFNDYYDLTGYEIGLHNISPLFVDSLFSLLVTNVSVINETLRQEMRYADRYASAPENMYSFCHA
jgi:FMN phosphatase YigB (HAD superfamily)